MFADLALQVGQEVVLEELGILGEGFLFRERYFNITFLLQLAHDLARQPPQKPV